MQVFLRKIRSILGNQLGSVDIPNYRYYGGKDYKAIFHSDPNKAMIIPVTLPGGMGVLPVGLTLGKVYAGRTGYHVPYVPATPDAADGNMVCDDYRIAAFAVDDPSSTSYVVSMDDSYMFAVGDSVVVDDDDSSPTDAGLITAIDRTTYSHIATITVTNAMTGFTVAAMAVLYHKSDASTPFMKAVGFLDRSVDTGRGSRAAGASAGLIVSNAILYLNRLVNLDAAAKTDLGSPTESGQFLILK